MQSGFPGQFGRATTEGHKQDLHNFSNASKKNSAIHCLRCAAHVSWPLPQCRFDTAC